MGKIEYVWGSIVSIMGYEMATYIRIFFVTIMNLDIRRKKTEKKNRP